MQQEVLFSDSLSRAKFNFQVQAIPVLCRRKRIMFNKDDIKKLADNVGGVNNLSMQSGVRVSTLYRLIRGDVNPSYATLVRLNNVLESNNEQQLINS